MRFVARNMLLVMAVLVLRVSAAQAGPITYDIVDYPALESGGSVSGFITTNGTIGSDDPSSIVTSWQVTVSGPFGFTLSSAAGDTLGFLGDVITTPTQIQLSDLDANGYGAIEMNLIEPPIVFEEWGEFVSSNASAGPTRTAACGAGCFNPATYDWQTSGTDTLFGSDPSVVAQVAAVPEPSTVTLVLGPALLLLGKYRARHRRSATPTPSASPAAN